LTREVTLRILIDGRTKAINGPNINKNMQINPVYISKEGLQKLRDELNHLNTIKKKEVAARIEKAKEMGDLRENAEYHDAKDEMAWVVSRIITLNEQIARAKIVQKIDSDSVGIGNRVKLKSDKKEKIVTVVGAVEADPGQGLISNESPLGLALIGKKVGDTIQIQAPAGLITYYLLEIN
jgi:transcription elongation factor GreA